MLESEAQDILEKTGQKNKPRP